MVQAPIDRPVAWLVLAVAAGLKLWRLIQVAKRHRQSLALDPERFRASLEELWARQPHHH